MGEPLREEGDARQAELLRALEDFGTSERLRALDTLAALIAKGERDAALLDGRDHNPKLYDEASRLLGLLRALEERR